MNLLQKITHSNLLAAQDVAMANLESEPTLTKLQRYEAAANALVLRAALDGVHITVERRALPPFTMGHAQSVADVRHAAGDDRTYGGTLPAAEEAEASAAPAPQQAAEPEGMKCYSRDGEEYHHTDLAEFLEDLFVSEDIEVGTVYYEADCTTMTAGRLFDAGNVLEEADNQAGDLLGEIYDNDATSVPKAAKDELQAAMVRWADKHINLSRYWLIHGKARELKITEDDVKDYSQ